MDEPNVLFLDEPTNDLDIETLTQLEDLLDGWPGSMVVISHDRFFIERTTDRVFALLGDATLRMLPRGIDEYLERRQRMRGGRRRRAPAAAKPRRPPRRSPPPTRRAAKKELQKIERQLDKRRRARRPSCTRRSPSNATDFEKVAEARRGAARTGRGARGAGDALAGAGRGRLIVDVPSV